MSKKEKWYVQCRLEKDIPERNAIKYMVSWIQESIAIPGALIRLKNEDGDWDENWKVINRGTTKISQQKASTLAHGSKNFKENTDI